MRVYLIYYKILKYSAMLLYSGFLIVFFWGGADALAQPLSTSLSSGFIQHIQDKFKGRIVSIAPHNPSSGGKCKTYEVDAVIDAKTVKMKGLVCRQKDGIWAIRNYSDIQLLNRDGKILIITVDNIKEKIIQVQE